MVRVPYCLGRSASAITCLISLIPASTAENSMNSALVMLAMIFARVVFPVPGGPQKINDPESSRSICTRSGLPGPIRCSWPAYSSSVRGRMRSASGRVASAALPAFGIGWKRLMACRSRVPLTQLTSVAAALTLYLATIPGIAAASIDASGLTLYHSPTHDRRNRISLPHSRAVGGRRNGRGLQSGGHGAWPFRCFEIPAERPGPRSSSARALPARGAGGVFTEPSKYLHHLRNRQERRSDVYCHGVPRWHNPQAPHQCATDRQRSVAHAGGRDRRRA